MNKIWTGLAVVLLLLAGRAQAETWADWMAAPANAPLAAEFQPGWAVEEGRKYSSSRTEEFVEQNRGYDGELVFTLVPGADAPAGPLAVRLRHVVVPPDGINWPKGDMPTNFVPMPLGAWVPGPPAAEESWTVAAEFPLRIPVVRPRACASPVSWRSRKAAGLFGGYEVRDAAGAVVARGWLPARRLLESARALVGVMEDDEAMKQVTERSGNVERVNDLPEAMEAYRQVRAIWFTDALWEKMAGREALGRRLLLSGVRLTGETALVKRIQADLGTGWKGLAVAESAVPSQLSSKSLFSLRALDLARLSEDDPDCSKPRREKSVFGNEANLFAADRNIFLWWTLGGFIVFAVGTVAILAMVFIRHKGERRVAIWWALPAWALLCAGVLWGGGRLVLDRRARADVTEYRLMMAGWPEMHVRVVASAMTFEPGRPLWALPADAVLYIQRSERLDGWWARQDDHRSLTGGPERRLQLPRKPTGSTLEVEAGWFEAAAAPVALEDGTLEQPGRWAVATEDTDGVYVLAQGRWRDLGPMKAGERLDPLAVDGLEPNRLPGLPTELQNGQSSWLWREPCRNPAHNHPPEERLPPKHDWVVVAWRREVPPRVAPVWAESRTEGRVIWVVQWP